MDHVLVTDRKVISSCCSVSWVIEAFRYKKFLWSRPWRGNTWWRRRGVVRKDRLISWWVGAMTYHMNGPSVKLSWRWALCQSCFFDNTRRQSWQTSQPACHLFPERCRFIRWLYWGQAQLSVRMLDVNVPQRKNVKQVLQCGEFNRTFSQAYFPSWSRKEVAPATVQLLTPVQKCLEVPLSLMAARCWLQKKLYRSW